MGEWPQITSHPGIIDSSLSGLKATESKRYILLAAFKLPLLEVHPVSVK